MSAVVETVISLKIGGGVKVVAGRSQISSALLFSVCVEGCGVLGVWLIFDMLLSLSSCDFLISVMWSRTICWFVSLS